MLNSILRACIQQAVHAGSLYVTTTISVANPYKYWAPDANFGDILVVPTRTIILALPYES